MTTVTGPDSSKEEQLKEWIDQYQGILLRTCYMYLHDTALAEDAVQETYIKAYRAMDKRNGQGSPRAWLTKIAINICRDMLRSAWFSHTDRRITPDDLPEQGTEDNPEYNELTAEIMNLPKKLREVLILYYEQNMTMTEIADILEISQPAVNTRLQRARNKIRNQLMKGDEEDG